ncbi:nucleotide exchange factor GrpE [Nocardia sp. NPDC057227]|uniref:nucleotide exchange factor GrpE n=1 Tax=Nocardia sp. NPDC057227 TaxID=3346056 RepID=UPI00362E9816
MSSDSDLADRIDGVKAELTALTDLFNRRLREDRVNRQLVEALQVRAEAAEAGLATEYLLPVVLQLTRLVDRAEQRPAETDPFVSSLLDEIHVILENCGVRSFGQAREPIDRAVHEMRAVRGEPGGQLLVDVVLRRGYSYMGRTIRAAVVEAVYADPAP